MGIKFDFGTKLLLGQLATILNAGEWSVVGGQATSTPGLPATLPLSIRSADTVDRSRSLLLYTNGTTFARVVKEIRQITPYEIRVYGMVEKAHLRAKSEGGGTQMLPVVTVILKLMNLGAKKLADEKQIQENRNWQLVENIRRRNEKALERRKTYNAERRIARALGNGIKVKFRPFAKLEISVAGKKKKVVIEHLADSSGGAWTTINGIDINDPSAP